MFRYSVNVSGSSNHDIGYVDAQLGVAFGLFSLRLTLALLPCLSSQCPSRKTEILAGSIIGLQSLP